MGIWHRVGAIGKKLLDKTLKEFQSSITATWKVDSPGTYDEFTGDYVGGSSSTETMSIDGIVDDDRIQFKYAKYGTDERTDLIVIVRDTFVPPPQDATYKRTGDPRSFKLKDIYQEANFGTDANNVQEFAYKLLHLRAP